MVKTTFLALFLLCISVAQANECLKKALVVLQNDSAISSLQTKVLKKVNIILGQTQKITNLKKASKTAKGTGKQKQGLEFDSKIEAWRKSLQGQNDSLMKSISELLNLQGVKHSLYTENGFLHILLDLSEAPKSQPALRFYARAKSIFGVERVTISLIDTVLRPRSAFFNKKNKRVELGLKEFVYMQEGSIGVSSRHEFRHSGFAKRRKKGDVSPYHLKFYKSEKGKLLNEHLKYDEQMSAEEIYNWSTDLGTLAIMVRDAQKDSLPEVLDRVGGKISGGLIINEATRDLTALMIDRLQDTIKTEKFGRIKLTLKKNQVSFHDSFGRLVNLLFVGDELKPLLVNAKKLRKIIHKKSIEMRKQSWPKKFKETPEGIALVNRLNKMKLKIAENMMERLEVLNYVTGEQVKALKELQAIYHSLGDSPTLAQLEALRAQMKTVANNVKEEFKDSLLNAR